MVWRWLAGRARVRVSQGEGKEKMAGEYVFLTYCYNRKKGYVRTRNTGVGFRQVLPPLVKTYMISGCAYLCIKNKSTTLAWALNHE